MKTVMSKKLTSNDKINHYILAQFDLENNITYNLTLLEEIERAFLYEEITREEMDTIFYDVYCINEINDITDRFTPYHIQILANLGYVHDKIVKNSTNTDALIAIIKQYKYLDEHLEHSNSDVRYYARTYRNELNRAKASHSPILKLMNELDPTLFHLKELDKNSVKVFTQNRVYIEKNFNFNVHVKVIDCDESFSIDLWYNMYPEIRCQRAERFFNEYNFKELPSLPKYPYMKCGKITDIPFEQVLKFIHRESHMTY